MTDWIIFVIAIGAVALFVLGLSLTQIFKGHPIDSEIGTNRHMRQRGIRCTAGEFMREESKRSEGTNPTETGCVVCNPETNGTADCCTCMSPCDAGIHEALVLRLVPVRKNAPGPATLLRINTGCGYFLDLQFIIRISIYLYPIR